MKLNEHIINSVFLYKSIKRKDAIKILIEFLNYKLKEIMILFHL